MPNKTGAATSLIPIQYIDNSFLVRSDGYPVFVWEVEEGVNVYNKTGAELETLIANFNKLFTSMASTDMLQIVASYRPLDPKASFDKYMADTPKPTDHVTVNLLEAQKQWLYRLAETSNTGQIRYFILFTSKAKDRKDFNVLIPEITTRSLSIKSYLSRIGLALRPLGKHEIKDLLDREINPFLPRLSDAAFSRGGKSSDGQGFASQKEILARDAIVPRKDHLEFGCGYVARTLYLEALPYEGLAPFMRNVYTQCGYFRLSLFAYGVDQQFAYTKFERQFFQQGQKIYLDKNYDARSRAGEEQSKVLIDRFARGELAFSRFNFYITLYAETLTELNNNTAAFEGVCADYPIQRGNMEQDILYRSSLPCCHDTAAIRVINNDHRFYNPSEGLANAFPFINARVGMRSGAIIGFDNLGEPVHFNPWARDELENPVHVILGQMGSGKSFQQELVEARQAPFDTVTCIFHKSSNYDFSTKLFGGDVIDYDLESDTHANVWEPGDPEELVKGPSPETVALVSAFLNVLLPDKGSSGLNSMEEGLLDQAIRRTYTDIKGHVPLLEDLAKTATRMLKELDTDRHKQILRDIILKLEPYIGNGTFAKITNRHSTIKINSSRVVINMSKIPANNDKILSLSIISAMSILEKLLKKYKDKKYRKVKFDETWAILKSEAGAKLIDNLVRRTRHLNLVPEIVSQFPSDLLETATARSIIQGAKCVTLLQQSSNDLPLLKEIFGLNDAEIEIVRSLAQVKGSYSQAYMITGKRRGLVNIMADPYTYWIATSEPKVDLPARAAMMKKHTREDGTIDYWAVVEELARPA